MNSAPSSADPDCREAVAAERTADLTKALVIVGAVQAVLLLGQIAALVVTIRQSRIATKAAVDSVRASQRSAKAAEDAVAKTDRLLSHAEQTARDQLRAYLFIDEGRLLNVGTGNTWHAEIKISNGGQTPAYDVESVTSIRGDHFPLHRPLLEIPNYSPTGKSIVGPGGAFILKPNLLDKPTQHSTEAFLSGRATVHVTGLITYRDIFGEEQWLTFRFFAGGAMPFDQSCALSPHDIGNVAS